MSSGMLRRIVRDVSKDPSSASNSPSQRISYQHPHNNKHSLHSKLSCSALPSASGSFKLPVLRTSPPLLTSTAPHVLNPLPSQNKSISNTSAAGRLVELHSCIQTVPVRIPTGTPVTLTESFRGFPHFRWRTSGRTHRLAHDGSFPNTEQFTNSTC